MKKKIFGLMLFAVVAMCPFLVNAEEDALSKFTTCVTGSSNTCTLTEDIVTTAPIDVVGNIVLDLNGHSIVADFNDTRGVLIVHNGASLTINDTVGTGKISTGESTTYVGVVLTKTGDEATKPAKLTVNGGTIEGYYYGIAGNGTRHNTEIVINGGKVEGLNGAAIFHPQDGVLTVNGGTIQGLTGIEMRAGDLEVNGGTIIGTYVPTEAEGNLSGSTTLGAGIAVAQHTTKLEIKVVINKGTIQGYTPLYQSTTEEGITAEDIAKISITVKGGSLEIINEGTNVIYSGDNRVVVEGGSFSGEISEDLAKEGSEVYEVLTPEGETQYVVATEEELEETHFIAESEIVDHEEFIEEFEAFVKEVEEQLEELDEEEKAFVEKYINDIKEAIEGKTLISAYDILYGNVLGENFVYDSEKTELAKKVLVSLLVPEDLPELKDGFVRKYSVIRIHINSESGEPEVAVLEAEDNEDGTVSFESDKFSTYILAYEDVKDTKNPETSDGIISVIFMAVLSISALAVIAVAKKRFN